MKTIETLANFESLSIGSCWEIAHHINCFKTSSCCELATQAFEGRRFKVIQWSSKACSNSQPLKRIKICLLEDGYQCWIDFADIENKAFFETVVNIEEDECHLFLKYLTMYEAHTYSGDTG